MAKTSAGNEWRKKQNRKMLETPTPSKPKSSTPIIPSLKERLRTTGAESDREKLKELLKKKRNEQVKKSY
tara:strand:- start:527 stop:736 length:210 start_codon:yes stop_codon:yes gene_type:complete